MASLSGPGVKERTDFDDAYEGWLASGVPCTIYSTDGERVVWDNDQYAFLKKTDHPEYASESLWRQSQLCFRQGLYKVTDRIYQGRGFDLSNMKIVEGNTGLLL